MERYAKRQWKTGRMRIILMMKLNKFHLSLKGTVWYNTSGANPNVSQPHGEHIQHF